jgi:transketolase
MSSVARAPHVASSLSCVDILVALYFHAARVDPASAEAPDRDRVILSKGHASAALYACLAERGYFDRSRLTSYCADGSPLAEHPSRGTLPGIEASTGSLGHGLGLGAGMALAARRRGSASRVFVVLSDGECNEGTVWEAAMWAPRHSLSNLIAIVDFNKFQATGDSTRITQLTPLDEKWRSFGWDCTEVDGHDHAQLLASFAPSARVRPRAVIAHTIKGKGVSFMEANLEWHYRPPLGAEYERALEELEEPG